MSIDSAIGSVMLAQQSALASQVGTEVAKKQLDAIQAQGDAVNQLLQSAAQLSKAIGKGEGLDAVG
jgi:hypothetical protein